MIELVVELKGACTSLLLLLENSLDFQVAADRCWFKRWLHLPRCLSYMSNMLQNRAAEYLC